MDPSIDYSLLSYWRNSPDRTANLLRIMMILQHLVSQSANGEPSIPPVEVAEAADSTEAGLIKSRGLT